MNPWISKIAIVFAAVVACSTVTVWYRISYRSVAPGIEQGIRTVVQRNPALQALFDQAMTDGVLTMAEANGIIRAAEQSKKTPN